MFYLRDARFLHSTLFIDIFELQKIQIFKSLKFTVYLSNNVHVTHAIRLRSFIIT